MCVCVCLCVCIAFQYKQNQLYSFIRKYANCAAKEKSRKNTGKASMMPMRCGNKLENI